MQDEQLNFEAAVGVAESTADSQAANLLPEAVAGGLSVGASFLVFLLILVVTLKLKWSRLHVAPGFEKPVVNHYHLLSFLVSTFLLLNLMFGGMTAIFLGRTSEDARAYFSEISAFKLAKLSHEHFFGYGLSFGLIALLAFVFVGPNQKRVFFPMTLMFAFGALDVASWWLTRFVSFGFHTLSYITGAVFAFSFCALYLQLITIHLKHLFTSIEKELT